MAGGCEPGGDAGNEEVDPASRRLVFWLEMENNMLRERVEESTLVTDALVRMLEHCLLDPTPQHLEWARECASCVQADPRLEKLYAQVEQTIPRTERKDTTAEPGSPPMKRWQTDGLKRSPTSDEMDPGSPRSFAERSAKRREEEAAAKQRAAAARDNQQRRGSRQKAVIPSADEIEQFPKVRVIEVRGLPKQLVGQTLYVGNHEIDQVVEVDAQKDSFDGSAMCRPGSAVSIQDSGAGDPETWVARITVRLGTQVVCKTAPIDLRELPARGNEPVEIAFYGKQKGRDGGVTTVQQGVLVATCD
jgi:hypothetical protein